MKSLIQKLVRAFGYEIRKFESPTDLRKAHSYLERFREIVSDPLNLLIRRVPEAGYVDAQGRVVLHNGNRVLLAGPLAYYSDFSQILVINRGVHEPLQEFCFQTLLAHMAAEAPVMIELGAYWGHYSMWVKKAKPRAACILIESDPERLECGKNNFALNGYQGEFINATLDEKGFSIDDYIVKAGLPVVDILHADIQGAELSMLKGAHGSLANKTIRYLFVSTHSQAIHDRCIDMLTQCAYRIDVSSDFDRHTTSQDGFIVASRPAEEAVFSSFHPLGRLEIAHASPEDLLSSLASAASRARA